MMKHSPIGASSAERWMNCPGSVVLSEKAGPAPASVYAEEGTAAHELAEQCLTLECAPETFLGTEINGFAVDEDMALAVSKYLAVVYKYVAETPGDTYHDKNQTEGKLYVETKFQLDNLHPMLFGTNDACVVGLEKLVVIDYKHGVGKKVVASNNPQLMYYAFGALSLCKVPVKEVELVIVQPRYRGGGEPVNSVIMKQGDLVTWGREILKPAAEKAMSGIQDTKPGTWCRWCPGAVICDKVRKQAAEAAGLMFDPLVQPTSESTVLKDYKSLTGEELSNLLDFASIMEPWFKGLRSYAFSRASEDSVSIPGWKIVKGKKTRKWADENKAQDHFTKIIGDRAYTPRKIKSIAQMEKEVKADKIEIPENMITITQGTTLAREEDKRAAFNNKDKMFDVLT